jgi:hypothetical protein
VTKKAAAEGILSTTPVDGCGMLRAQYRAGDVGLRGDLWNGEARQRRLEVHGGVPDDGSAPALTTHPDHAAGSVWHRRGRRLGVARTTWWRSRSHFLYDYRSFRGVPQFDSINLPSSIQVSVHPDIVAGCCIA